MRKIFNKIKLAWHALFFGMRGVDILLTSSHKSESGSGFEIPDDAGGGVFKDILEQKVTQEVQELRYTSYKVAKESKKYRYIGNGQVAKKTASQLSERHGAIDESDNLPIVLIQDNAVICEDVLTSLNEVNQKEGKKAFYEYNIKIERDNLPRFRIESYVKKLVLKESDGNYVIDLYCSKYPRQFSERKDRAFLKELKQVQTGIIRNSDIFDFQELHFTTSNAWGVDDWFRFSFKEFELYDIIEYDGNYIVRMGCLAKNFMENLLDKVFCESAEKKYEAKEAKENAIIDFSDYSQETEYVIDKNIDLETLENVKFSIDSTNIE